MNLIPVAIDPTLLEAELAVCFESKVHSLCFFWSVDVEAVARAKDAGCLVLYQVGSVEDAVATEESFAHDYHKTQVGAAGLENTVHTGAFAINWPPNSPVRVIANRLTDKLGQRLFGYRAADIPRETIADDDGRPIYKFSTDSPLRTTTGDLELLALFAGQVTGAIETVPSAAARITEIVGSARATLERLQRTGTTIT